MGGKENDENVTKTEGGIWRVLNDDNVNIFSPTVIFTVAESNKQHLKTSINWFTENEIFL